jgi:quinol monooxygenase YgiN
MIQPTSLQGAVEMANGRLMNENHAMVLSFRITAPDEKLDDVLRSLHSLVGPASAEAACLVCRVLQDAGSPHAISFVQAWTKRRELQRHVRSQQYRQLLSVLDYSTTMPDIRLDEVNAIDTGIGVLAALASDQENTDLNTTEGGFK